MGCATSAAAKPEQKVVKQRRRPDPAETPCRRRRLDLLRLHVSSPQRILARHISKLEARNPEPQNSKAPSRELQILSGEPLQIVKREPPQALGNPKPSNRYTTPWWRDQG